MTVFLLTLTGFYLYIAWLQLVYLDFQKQRDKIEWRVHVNGIRGKSTVTRYVTAVFRETGYHTFGKTTGSAARILRPDGQDYDFGRKGYPNVNEQVKMVKDFSRQKAEAAVLECMAVNPVYAKWLEEKVMRSHIGIITNVRYDHPEYMGETLEEIAESLSNTIPENGILITAETEPRLLKILKKNAKRKNSLLLVADGQTIDVSDLAGFSHFAIEENIAIGYEIARLLKIPKNRALKAMQNAVADPGAFSVQFIKFQHYQIAWANLFAVNDRESFVQLSQKLFKQYPEHQKVVILNNRHDRPARVELFANLAHDLEFNWVVTLGDYEEEVNRVFDRDKTRVINLGHSSKFKGASATQLLTQITSKANSEKILLIGTVNIHTDQAELLLHFFEEQLNLETAASTEPVEVEKVDV
ncbi:MAG: poly-gamma-glutamate synthase PgsB [Microcoleus vaginatus WJT46-NPBG5]|jgi:poly-gamma-glutamate synthase PgsB/CapB|nr:poly-gamma-glutamate synthase PgsB [Microcoleus vaginatus WJT46-NPBG5]